MTGQHAASIPATIDPGGGRRQLPPADRGRRAGDRGSAAIENAATVSGSGPQPALANVVDLDPATTYHYRFAVEQQSGGADVLGPEGTFTTPPYPVAAARTRVQKARFKLRKGQIRIGRLEAPLESADRQGQGLPARIKVKLKLTAAKSKQSARKKGEGERQGQVQARRSPNGSAKRCATGS